MRKEVARTDVVVAVGALVLLASLAYLLVRAFMGYDLVDSLRTPGREAVVADREEMWPWALAALIGGVLVTSGWWRHRAAAAGRAVG